MADYNSKYTGAQIDEAVALTNANKADIATNKADITKNTEDIARNTSNIATNTNNVNSILDIIDIAGEKINADALKNSINGDDDVIVDESNEKLGIHLSPELQEKLARMLLKPLTAPATRKVVTIDTNNNQDNVDSTSLPTLMSNIVDSQGHKRFIEGDMHYQSSDGSASQPESITITYAKWSLSGSHFMMVLCGSIAKNVKSTSQISYFTKNLPGWVSDKIRPLHGKGNMIGSANMFIFDRADPNNPVYRESIVVPIHKWGPVGFYTYDNFKTFDYDGSFRVQFDLLIDSD